MGQTERGFLVLADVSGYTAFVTATELEHGPPIVAELLEAVIGGISPPLDVLQVEGDAVFALGLDGRVTPPAVLLDVLRAGFAEFRARRTALAADDSCACRACRGVGRLRLKIVGHHGGFLRQTIGGRVQAAGSDVILVHRLLKNGVARGDDYALFTRSALDSMGVDPARAGLAARTERYEHFGEVPCYVMSASPAGSAHPEGLGFGGLRTSLA
jgi:hypothetical protein